jgi:hypothetical protein
MSLFEVVVELVVVVVENSRVGDQSKIEMNQHSILEDHQREMKIQKRPPIFHQFVI